MAKLRREQAFTLVELILVMGLLAIVLAIASPALSRFVHGRGLQEESRRFLALTRYARSEAASRGIPMRVWVDPEQGTYGLGPAAGFETEADRDLDYTLAEGLRFEVDEEVLDDEGIGVIAYEPDGSIETESLQSLRIEQDDNDVLEITRGEFGVAFEAREPDDES